MSMSEHLGAQTEVVAALHEVRRRWSVTPRVGIVLGTGLGSYAKQIRIDCEIEYDEISSLNKTTALGHRGRFLCGTVGGVSVIAMDGRYHRYEGWSMDLLTRPIRLMGGLGIERLILSNAAGGVHPRFRQGDVMLIEDHLNLLGGNPFQEQQDRFPTLGTRKFYDTSLIKLAQKIARRHGFTVPQGVYAALTGPNYETRAEYRMLRRMGADVVGMSTVPETLVAAQIGVPVLAISAVTNVCRPDSLVKTEGHAVIEVARSTEPKMRDIVTGMIAEMAR